HPPLPTPPPNTPTSPHGPCPTSPPGNRAPAPTAPHGTVHDRIRPITDRKTTPNAAPFRPSRPPHPHLHKPVQPVEQRRFVFSTPGRPAHGPRTATLRHPRRRSAMNKRNRLLNKRIFLDNARSATP